MISIVIPAHNEEMYLPECLDSLKKQDYTGDYEIIVADNGSTDQTTVIARNFGAKVIPCFKEKSVIYARQAGAEAALGEIIVQADADTVYPKDWLSKIVEHFNNNPDIVAVAGRYIYREPPSWANIEYFLKSMLNRLTILFFGRPMIISGATFAFRRNEFLSGDGYLGLSCYPDQFGISSRLSEKGRVHYDKNICVLTSSRRVQKSFLLILNDVIRNIANLALYFFRWSIISLYQSLTLTPARRVTFYISVLLVVIIFFSLFASSIPSTQAFGKVYYEADTSEQIIALSFDDGPNDPYTSQILDILSEFDVKATFFIVGKNAELYPDTVKRIVREGHVIGNHSFSHDFIETITEFDSSDIQLAQEVIYNITGIMPYLYRPPRGLKTPWELESAEELGMITITWSVTTDEFDEETLFDESSVSDGIHDIINKVEPGEIIFLYDGHGTDHDTPDSDQSLTVQALPEIIKQLRGKGYRFVTIPELLEVPAYIRQEP
ncbi:MAG: glycosyltransferase [Dehalococcoidales bacterium]|nr:glycosyltransferase [Dehalococcoidales bacterium]